MFFWGFLDLFVYITTNYRQNIYIYLYFFLFRSENKCTKKYPASFFFVACFVLLKIIINRKKNQQISIFFCFKKNLNNVNDMTVVWFKKKKKYWLSELVITITQTHRYLFIQLYTRPVCVCVFSIPISSIPSNLFWSKKNKIWNLEVGFMFVTSDSEKKSKNLIDFIWHPANQVFFLYTRC